MLYRNTNGACAGVMLGGREQPGDARCLAIEPAALSTGSGCFAHRLWPGRSSFRRKHRVYARLCAKINANECAALPFDKARNRVAATACIQRAISGNQARPQCRGVHLDDMCARQDTFEMIPAVGIGYRIAAVLQHDANATDPIGFVRIDGTAAVGDPSDDGQAVRQRVAGNAHHGIGYGAHGATAVARLRPVHGLPCFGIGADFEEICQRARGACRKR